MVRRSSPGRAAGVSARAGWKTPAEPVEPRVPARGSRMKQRTGNRQTKRTPRFPRSNRRPSVGRQVTGYQVTPRQAIRGSRCADWRSSVQWKFLWIIFPQPARRREGNVVAHPDLTDPQIRYGHWGIAELAAFKLQWICSDRNIDRARKGLGRWDGCAQSRNRRSPFRDCRLLHSCPDLSVSF